MATSNSLSPIKTADFGAAQAHHLLNRAGFGGTPRQVDALVGMGLNRAVDHLVNYGSIDPADLPGPEVDADLIEPAPREQRQKMRRARRDQDEQMMADFRAQRRQRRQADREQHRRLQRWWMSRMFATSRPMEEKMTLLWHGHFASNHRTVRDSYLMFQQNVLFRRHAVGRFSDLAFGIIHDPAMIRFLDNHNNRKQKPNENLARELMELFTLGEGNYTEADIKQGARALTGYTYQDNDFHFAQRAHDPGPKVILGQRGRFDGDDFVRILLRQKACPRFVCYKLYNHLVGDVAYEHLADMPAARSVIWQMARELERREYQIAPVLRQLLRSRHFYDDAIIGNKIKSPAQLLVGTVRMMNVPARDLDTLVDAMRLMGQDPFDPPSVAGWPGGRSWINTSTLFVRQNLCAFLITGKRPGDQSWSTAQIDYDPMFLLEGLATRSHEAIVDRLLSTLLSGQVPAQRRRQMLQFLDQRSGPVKRDTIVALLLLLTAMPEYQLC